MGIMSSLGRVFARGISEQKSIRLTDPEAFALFGITGTGAGVSIGPRSAMRVPAVACAVSLIAETAGSLPAKIYNRETRETDKAHPAYILIHDEANPWTSAEALRVQITTDALLHGHGFALVVRNDAGAPLELHRLEPTAVQIDPLPDGEPSYVVTFDDGKRRVPFTDILHISAFGGIAPVQLGREAIGLALAFETHIAKLFANGAQPGGRLTMPAPPRACSCGRLVPAGALCECQRDQTRARGRRHDQNRPTAAQRGYNHEWRKARAAFLLAHPSCALCFAPATVVDHITPHRGDDALFWNRQNWQPLCASCHNRAKQRLERAGS